MLRSSGGGASSSSLLAPLRLIKSSCSIGFSAGFESICASSSPFGAGGGCVAQTFSTSDGASSGVVSLHEYPSGCRVFLVEDLIIAVDLSAVGGFHVFDKETKAYIKSYQHAKKKGGHLITSICASNDKDGLLFFCYDYESKIYCASISADFCNFYGPIRLDLTGFSSSKMLISNIISHPMRSWIFVLISGKLIAWNYSNLKRRLNKMETKEEDGGGGDDGDNAIVDNEGDDASDTASVKSGTSSRMNSSRSYQGSRVGSTKGVGWGSTSGNKTPDLSNRLMFVSGKEGFISCYKLGFNKTGLMMGLSWSDSKESVSDIITLFDIENPGSARNISHGVMSPFLTCMLSSTLQMLSTSINTSNSYLNPILKCHSVCFHPSQPLILASVGQTTRSHQSDRFLVCFSLLQNGAPLNAIQSINSLFPMFSPADNVTSEVAISNDLSRSSIIFDDVCISHFSEVILITAKIVCMAKGLGEESHFVSISRFSDFFADRYFISNLVCNHYHTHPDIFLFGDSVLDIETHYPNKPGFRSAGGSADKGLSSNATAISKNLMRSRLITIKSTIKCNSADEKGNVFDLVYTIYLGNLGMGLSMSSEDQKEKDSSQESSKNNGDSFAIGSSSSSCTELLTISRNSVLGSGGSGSGSVGGKGSDWLGSRSDLQLWNGLSLNQPFIIKTVKCAVGDNRLYAITRGITLGLPSSENQRLPPRDISSSTASQFDSGTSNSAITGFFRFAPNTIDAEDAYYSWYTCRDADFFSSLDSVHQQSHLAEKPLGFLCIGADGICLKWLLFPTSSPSSEKAADKASWDLPCPMTRLWTAELGAPNIVVFASEVSLSTENRQIIYSSNPGDPSMSTAVHKMILFPCEIIQELVWQPLPSSMNTRADKASESERNVQSIWLKSTLSSDPLIGILTNMRVLIVTNKLVVVNEHGYNVSTYAEGFGFLRHGTNLSKYHQHRQNIVTSIMWIGRSLAYSEISGAISYLLPYKQANKLRFGPMPHVLSRHNDTIISSAGSGGNIGGGSNILCHIDNYISVNGLRLVTCLPDRLIFITKVGSSVEQYASSIAMITRPCLPSEPLILGLLEMASLHFTSSSSSSSLASSEVSASLNLSSPPVVIEAIITALVSQYYVPNDSKESQIKPTSHITSKLCQSLNAFGFPVLAAATAGLPVTVPQGGLPEFPTIRWIHSNLKFFVGLEAGGVESACASFIVQKYDWFEKFIDPDSFGGALSHSSSPGSKQCSYLARLLLTFGKFDYARKFADISGDDSLLALLLALNQKEVISSTQQQSSTSTTSAASATTTTTSPLLLPGGNDSAKPATTLAPHLSGSKPSLGLLAPAPGVGGSVAKRGGLPSGGLTNALPSKVGMKSLSSATVAVNDSDKNAKKLVSDDMANFIGALDGRNIRLKVKIQEMIRQLGRTMDTSADSNSIYLPSDAFNCTRRNVMLSVGKPFYFNKDMYAESIAKTNSLLAVASAAKSPLQAFYDANKRSTNRVPVGVSSSINKSFSFPLEGSASWSMGLLAMDSTEDWLGLKIKPEGINISKSGEEKQGFGLGTYSSQLPTKGGASSDKMSPNAGKSKNWVDGVGQGLTHDKVGGYWRFSDMVVVGEEGFVSTRQPGARCCFIDLSKYSNPMELFCENGSDLVVTETDSNVDPGDDPKKVKGLNDIVFMKDSISENESPTVVQGLRVVASRGNSIDTGILQNDSDRCKQTIEFSAKLSLVGLSSKSNIVLLRRVLADESKIVFSLIVNEAGHVHFYIGNSKGSSNSDTNLISPEPINTTDKITDWFHIALTIDSSQFDGSIAVQIYLNGEKLMKGTMNIIGCASESDLDESTLYFCSHITSSSRLTEVRVWADVRTSNEIDDNKENYLTLASKQKRLQMTSFKSTKGVIPVQQLFAKIRETFSFGDPSAVIVLKPTNGEGKDDAALSSGESSSSAGGGAPLKPLSLLGLAKPNSNVAVISESRAIVSGPSGGVANDEVGGNKAGGLGLALPKPGGLGLAPPLSKPKVIATNSDLDHNPNPLGTSSAGNTTESTEILSKPSSVSSTASTASSPMQLPQKLILHRNCRQFQLKNDIRTSCLHADGTFAVYLAANATTDAPGSVPVTLTKIVEGHSNITYRCRDLLADSAVASPSWTENGNDEYLYLMTYSANKITFFLVKLPSIDESSSIAKDMPVLDCRKIHEYPLESLVYWKITPLFRLYLVTSNIVGMYNLRPLGHVSSSTSFAGLRPIKVAERNDIEDVAKWKSRRVWDLSECCGGHTLSIVSSSMDLELNSETIVTSLYSVPKPDKSIPVRQLNVALRALQCSLSNVDSSDENLLIMWCKNSSFKKLESSNFAVTCVNISTLQRLSNSISSNSSGSSGGGSSSGNSSYKKPSRIDELIPSSDMIWSAHLEDSLGGVKTGGGASLPNPNSLMRIIRLGNAVFRFGKYVSIVLAQPQASVIYFYLSITDGVVSDPCKVSLSSVPGTETPTSAAATTVEQYNAKVNSVLINCVQPKASQSKASNPFSIIFATNSGEIWTLKNMS